MTFNIIELENWDRKEYFEHYFNQQTTYSITKEIDITLFKDMIKKKGYEIYPSLIYAIMEVVNKNKVKSRLLCKMLYNVFTIST
uniref:CatA-like O-acetyltransferase n=1 Tax=Staphylococcus pseudintermedius TaxID=283734 RepID=UPI001F4D93F6